MGSSSPKTHMTPPDLASYPGLDEDQRGHLRHIHNLAAQLPGDWSRMGDGDPAQESFSAYRFQLAYMAYALGLAYRHRLPAAREPMRQTFQLLIEKMLRRDVWSYWKDISRSSPRLDPDLVGLRPSVTDPIGRENIMYSGHLHAMAGLYAVLFDDDRFAAPGALTVSQSSRLWGLGPETYAYDFRKLNETIYWQMVENGWLGVACEPNCIFIVCNQFPMLGFRFHDLRHGTAIAEEATESYRKTWDERGLLAPNGNLVSYLRHRQDVPFAGYAAMDAWTGSAMNAWNSDFVHEHCSGPVLRHLRRMPDGLLCPHPQSLADPIQDALARGRSTDALEDRGFKWRHPDFGLIAIFLSELGYRDELDGLLAYADTYLNPTWERGGLYYPRSDLSYDDAGLLRFMDPLTGNALLGYARLNVTDGLKALFERPPGRADYDAPHLSATPTGMDITRARWDAAAETLAISLRAVEGPVETHLSVASLPAGRTWTIWLDGERWAEGHDQAWHGPGSGRVRLGVGAMTLDLGRLGSVDLAIVGDHD